MCTLIYLDLQMFTMCSTLFVYKIKKKYYEGGSLVAPCLMMYYGWGIQLINQQVYNKPYTHMKWLLMM